MVRGAEGYPSKFASLSLQTLPNSQSILSRRLLSREQPQMMTQNSNPSEGLPFTSKSSKTPGPQQDSQPVLGYSRSYCSVNFNTGFGGLFPQTPK